MHVIRVDDEREDTGLALGSALVSLLEPGPGQARALHRWYERDHFYAGCMAGPGFFAGRRFLATPALRTLRYPAASAAVPDTSIGSQLALYWLERGQHETAERWAVERVKWLHEHGRMAAGVERRLVHGSFHDHRWTACRDRDGVPPELALDHPFAGVVLVLSQRPEEVSAEVRDRWLLEERLPSVLPGSDAALCLSLAPRPLPEDSPAWSPPTAGSDRRHLEIWFLERDPREAWEPLFADFGARQAEAGAGEVAFAAAFLPSVPGTDLHVESG